MKFLTKVEEEVMLYLWKLGEAYVTELLELYPEPKPNYNTVSSFVRILEKKGFVDHKVEGKFHKYYAVVTQEAYRQCLLNLVIRNYFANDVQSLCEYLSGEYNEYNEKYADFLSMLKATIGDDNYVKNKSNNKLVKINNKSIKFDDNKLTTKSDLKQPEKQINKLEDNSNTYIFGKFDNKKKKSNVLSIIELDSKEKKSKKDKSKKKKK